MELSIIDLRKNGAACLDPSPDDQAIPSPPSARCVREVSLRRADVLAQKEGWQQVIGPLAGQLERDTVMPEGGHVLGTWLRVMTFVAQGDNVKAREPILLCVVLQQTVEAIPGATLQRRLAA